MKTEIITEMMVQRGFKELKNRETYLMGVRHHDNKEDEHIYIKLFDGKLELNVIREFLSSKFILCGDMIRLKRTDPKNQLLVVELVIVCKSFQKSHVKEFKEVSNRIQLIKSDFFNINITKKTPYHHKIDSNFITNKRNLPTLKVEDPNCIFYNFKKGDLIRVVRSDGDICYRLVK